MTDPEMYRTFHRRGHAYVSNMVDHFGRSPVYVIASIAAKLIDDGEPVELPEDYNAEILGRIAWHTGFYGREVSISGRQADEMAQLGRHLLDRFESKLTPPDRAAIGWLLKVVQSTPEGTS